VTSGDHRLAKNSALPSVNGLVEPLVESLIRDAPALRVDVSKGSLGECRIDCGVKAIGGIEAGRRMAEVCLGGLITIPAAFVFLGAAGIVASLGSTGTGSARGIADRRATVYGWRAP